MKAINISELRSHLLQYMEEAAHGETIRVTSHGRTLADIVPATDRQQHDAEKLQWIAANAILGDVVSPLEDEWDAQKNYKL